MKYESLEPNGSFFMLHKNAMLGHGDCLELMKLIPDGSIDLTVTSPPYDNLRTYKDSLVWNEDIWKAVLCELYRITRHGGVVVWVVGDATIKGSETGTSFKQALYAIECGFNLHDTMIWHKNASPRDTRIPRYWQGFEYMFVLSKGKPKTLNFIKELCKTSGRKKQSYMRNPDGSMRLDRKKDSFVKQEKPKDNVWFYGVASNPNHPAPFPEALANDHIISWSNEGDTVFDPFVGSGTTGKMAILNNRKFIGIEKVKEYFEIAKKRIQES